MHNQKIILQGQLELQIQLFVLIEMVANFLFYSQTMGAHETTAKYHLETPPPLPPFPKECIICSK